MPVRVRRAQYEQAPDRSKSHPRPPASSPFLAVVKLLLPKTVEEGGATSLVLPITSVPGQIGRATTTAIARLARRLSPAPRRLYYYHRSSSCCTVPTRSRLLLPTTARQAGRLLQCQTRERARAPRMSGASARHVQERVNTAELGK